MTEDKNKITQRNIILRDEQKQLLYAVRSLNEMLMLRLGFYSGLRVSEITKLTPSDLDTNREVIRIRESKGGKTRYACIDRATLQLLVAIAEERHMLSESPYIQMDVRTLQRWFDAIQERSIGMKKYHMHDLRHTNITMLLEEGMGLMEVKDHAGHSDIRTTEIYTHFTVKKRVASYQRAVGGGLL